MDRAALPEVPGLARDPDHHVARDIGNVFVLHVEMFNVRKILFSFLMRVKCASPMLMYSPRNVHPGSRTRVSPCPEMRDPTRVTCASWESSPKLV